jgi:hypothetical protein
VGREMKTIDSFTEPFAIMKHGLDGYGEERRLWRSAEELIFFHILVGIKEELKRVEQRPHC